MAVIVTLAADYEISNGFRQQDQSVPHRLCFGTQGGLVQRVLALNVRALASAYTYC